LSIREHPLPELTEGTDVWVEGEITDMVIEPRPVYADPWKSMYGTGRPIRVKATVRVIRSVPELGVETLAVEHDTSTQGYGRFAEGETGFLALVKHEGVTPSVYKPSRWYAVTDDGYIARPVVELGESVPRTLFWELVTDLDALIAAEGVAGPEAVKRWTGHLATDHPEAITAALTYLKTALEVAVDPAAVVACLERMAARVHGARADGGAGATLLKRECVGVTRLALPLLETHADLAAVDALVALLEHDRSQFHSMFEERDLQTVLVRVVILRGGEKRMAIIRELMQEEVTRYGHNGNEWRQQALLDRGYRIFRDVAKLPGADVEAFLVDVLYNPELYGVDNTLEYAAVWEGLAQRGVTEVKGFLEDGLAQGEALQLSVPHHDGDVSTTLVYMRESLERYKRAVAGGGPPLHEDQVAAYIERYEEGNEDAIYELLHIVEAGDEHVIPLLRGLTFEQLEEKYRLVTFGRAVSKLTCDAALIEQVKEFAERQPNAGLLQALYACGEQELALKLGRRELAGAAPSGDGQALRRIIGRRAAIVGWFGKLEDPRLYSSIERFTRDEVCERYQAAVKAWAVKADRAGHPFMVWGLRKAAVLALVRTGHDGAVPRLRELVEHDDVGVRIMAAMGLHTLGDDGGAEWVRVFVEHQEKIHPDVRERWHVDLAGSGGYHMAVRYLENPNTDAVMLERLGKGFGNGDYSVFSDERFSALYRDEVLRAAAEGLTHRHRHIRADAQRALERGTGQNFGFEPDALLFTQKEPIAQWRDYVAQETGG
jgi:hypothetical protein